MFYLFIYYSIVGLSLLCQYNSLLLFFFPFLWFKIDLREYKWRLNEWKWMNEFFSLFVHRTWQITSPMLPKICSIREVRDRFVHHYFEPGFHWTPLFIVLLYLWWTKHLSLLLSLCQRVTSWSVLRVEPVRSSTASVTPSRLVSANFSTTRHRCSATIPGCPFDYCSHLTGSTQ